MYMFPFTLFKANEEIIGKGRLDPTAKNNVTEKEKNSHLWKNAIEKEKGADVQNRLLSTEWNNLNEIPESSMKLTRIKGIIKKLRI